MKTLAIIAALLLTGGTIYYVSSASDSDTETAEADTGKKGSRKGRSSKRDRSGRGGGGERSMRGSDHAVPADASLEERVAHLEREVEALRRASAIRGKVAVAGGNAPGSITEDPVLDAEVRDIYEQEREKEREHQRELRRDRIQEMRTAALDELVAAAGLNADQREKIDSLWTTEAEQIMPLFESARSGERSFMEVREEVRRVRKETDDAAKALLSEGQIENYDEYRPRGPGRGGRRGGGPRGG